MRAKKGKSTYGHTYSLYSGKVDLNMLETWSAQFPGMKTQKGSCLKRSVIIEDLSFRTEIRSTEYDSEGES